MSPPHDLLISKVLSHRTSVSAPFESEGAFRGCETKCSLKRDNKQNVKRYTKEEEAALQKAMAILKTHSRDDVAQSLNKAILQGAV